MPCPWAYTRRAVAKEWHCKPQDVDDAPIDEVLTELAILNCEAEAAEWRRQHSPQR